MYEHFKEQYIPAKSQTVFVSRPVCKIGKYLSILDPCGFRYLNNGRCWHGIPCCHSGCACEYLSNSGCTAHSLGCLFWLCRKSLDYLDQRASNPSDALSLQARSYLTLCPAWLKLPNNSSLCSNALPKTVHSFIPGKTRS